MAVALFKELISSRPDADQWRIESAGTWGYEGMPPSNGALKALKNRGLVVTNHRSRIVTRELVRAFDLILTMESGQKEALRFEFPEIARRLFLISEMIGQIYDIPDPMGGPLPGYIEIVNELDHLLSTGFDRIVSLAQRKTG